MGVKQVKTFLNNSEHTDRSRVRALALNDSFQSKATILLRHWANPAILIRIVLVSEPYTGTNEVGNLKRKGFYRSLLFFELDFNAPHNFTRSMVDFGKVF
jgi:hypothetical protein